MSGVDPVSGTAVDEIVVAARQHAERGGIALATELYQRLLEIAPDHPEALAFLGQRALNESRFAEAKQMLERAVEQAGGNIQLLKNLGLACIGAERLDEARFAFDRALRTLVAGSATVRPYTAERMDPVTLPPAAAVPAGFVAIPPGAFQFGVAGDEAARVGFYYAQPLLGQIGRDLGVGPAGLGLVTTVTQAGYFVGLIAPRGPQIPIYGEQTKLINKMIRLHEAAGPRGLSLAQYFATLQQPETRIDVVRAPWIDQILVGVTAGELAPGVYVAVIGCLALLALWKWPETAFSTLG